MSAYGAFPQDATSVDFQPVAARCSRSPSSPYSDMVCPAIGDAAARQAAASSPYGEFLTGNSVGALPFSPDECVTREKQTIRRHRELLRTLRESSGVCEDLISELEACSIPHAAAEFITVTRMCNVALQRLERYAHLLLTSTIASGSSGPPALPSRSKTTPDEPKPADAGSTASLLPTLSRAEDKRHVCTRREQNIVFQKTHDLFLEDGGTTAKWKSPLVRSAWMSTRATTSLCAGVYTIRYLVKRPRPIEPLRVGFMLEWVSPTGKKCVDWGRAGGVGASKSSWGVLVCGLTPDEMTSSVVGTMEDIATGCLPGLKVFEPTRPENEAAAVDDVTIQVDLDLPVHQHGMAQFRAFDHDAEETNFSWSVELPVGAVVVPAVSLFGKGQAVTMSVVSSEASDVSNCVPKRDPKHSLKDATLLSGSSNIYTAHLEPGFVRKLVVQVQNALSRFANQIQQCCDGRLKTAPSVFPVKVSASRTQLDRSERGIRLGKALSDPRQRQRVEHLSTFLCATVDPVRMVLHSLYLLNMKNNVRVDDSTPHGREDGENVYQNDEYYASSYGNCFRSDENSENDLTEQIITDPDGLHFWVDSFGRGTFQVPWSVFVAQVETYLSRGGQKFRLRGDQKNNLQIAVDNSRSGWVNMHSLASLLQGFGPGLSRSIEQMDSSLRQSWFHGFISGAESNEALLGCKPGTFLVRFSQSKQCAFVIAYVDRENDVKQTIVQATRNQGFHVAGAGDEYFGTLAEVIKKYGHVLKYPAPNTLSRCRWFHGFLTYSETVDLLSDKPVGSYLMRFSKSQPGSMVLAFRVDGMKNSRGKVQQSLIFSSPESGGYRIGDKQYANLESIIKDNSGRLLSPCFASPFEDDDEAVALKSCYGSTKHESVEESNTELNSDRVSYRGLLGSAGIPHAGLDYAASFAGVGYYGLVAPLKLATATHGAAALVGLNAEEKAAWIENERRSVAINKDERKTKICWEGPSGSIRCEWEQEPYGFINDMTSADEPSDAVDPEQHRSTEASSVSVEFPAEFLCPISLCVMTDPVIAGDSITYERSSIEKWLKAHGTSPHTRQAMNASELTPNRALLASIQSYRKLAVQMAEVKASLRQ